MSGISRKTFLAIALVLGLAPAIASAHPGHQHGMETGHLVGAGAWGNITKLSSLPLTHHPETVADVAVSPDGQTAYVANWGEPDCAGPEVGGRTSPDAGAWVVDIANLEAPREIGFIPSHQDTRPGEGMQVETITTKSFNGEILAMNNEQCGKNGKGGMSLWDVSTPSKPVRLSTHYGDRANIARGDANETHSTFIWDTGDNAYAVIVDNYENTDVDILDITNPKRPRLIRELQLDAMFPFITQTPLGLVQVNLHDMVVKQINGTWVMLLSYWDGGYVQLDVDDPINPILIGDTDFANPDPELLESTGVALPPEGNGHQAEFTSDNRFFIGTDEDFAPYGATRFRIASGPAAGGYPSVPVPGSTPIVTLSDDKLNGPAVYGGYGCSASAPVPTPESVPGYLTSLQPGEEKIVALQRGPVGDTTAPEAACFPGEKAHQAALAGWDAVLFINHHGGPENPPFCGSGGFSDAIVGVCTNHEAYHKLFGTPVSFTYPDGPARGAVSTGTIEATAAFDGWGYVHLYSNMPSAAKKFAELDTYAIDEAHMESYAVGFGDLTVHEVATDKVSPNHAYLSYYTGGLRSLKIECTSAVDPGTCELVEAGGYLDKQGNNFWGVETFVRNGRTIILGSDRDHGLWVFERTG